MKTSLLRYTLLLLLFLPTLLAAQSAEEEARRDVERLSSREMMGRGYYHGGHIRAAVYIADRFRALGLDSLSDGYLQQFRIEINQFPEAPSLRIDGREMRLGIDYLPHEESGTGSVQHARLVMAGSALVIPAKGIDDTARRSLAGAVAVISESVPDSIARDTTLKPKEWSLQTRLETLRKRGAAGVILLSDGLVMSTGSKPAVLPLIRMLRSAFPADAHRVKLRVRTQMFRNLTQNVIARIPGTHYPDSMVILCAHYDHLGGMGDSIYFPGANDNASGTAMLLSFARYFKEHPLKYSVVLMAFSGEEAGIKGSMYFVQNPLVDLSRIRFLLDMDMTASGSDGITAVGGENFPEEFALLRAVADSLGVKDVRKRPNVPISDHFFFVFKGARGFYVYPFTGLQPYHHVNDRPETLQWDVFLRLREIFRGFLERL